MGDLETWGGKFPRLFELYSQSDQSVLANWFRQSGTNRALSAEDPGHRRIEGELQQLDPLAWNAFKSKAARYVHLKDEWGYHRQLFDRFSEVKGYLYLTREGYQEIEFIPEQKNRVTPDLFARIGKSVAVMEVKTVNESNEQKDYLEISGDERECFDVLNHLPERFKKKLRSTLDHACAQVRTTSDPSIRRLVYFVIRPDNSVDANVEIGKFLRAHCPPEIEIVVELL